MREKEQKCQQCHALQEEANAAKKSARLSAAAHLESVRKLRGQASLRDESPLDQQLLLAAKSATKMVRQEMRQVMQKREEEKYIRIFVDFFHIGDTNFCIFYRDCHLPSCIILCNNWWPVV